jgi:hypothetical protein
MDLGIFIQFHCQPSLQREDIDAHARAHRPMRVIDKITYDRNEKLRKNGILKSNRDISSILIALQAL